MRTPVKTVRLWLKVIAHSKTDCGYVNGIKLFINDWENKTPTAIKRLCIQIKEVTVSNEVFAIAVFGKGATNFFKELDVDSISYTASG